jgi:hypothetical protein
MNLYLPDGKKVFLKGNLLYEERKQLVQSIIDEWEWYFTEYWNNPKTIACLDMMARYLSRASDFKDIEKPTLSTRKHAALEQGDWNCRLFSDLPKHTKMKIGIEDIIEDNYEE